MANSLRPDHPVRERGMARVAGWLRFLREPNFLVPLFALLLLGVGWTGTFQMVDTERAAAMASARDSTRELVDTYEAQVARNLDAIDQTLKVLRYAVELSGPQRALATLDERGLLPPGFVSFVTIADRNGVTVASHPSSGKVRNIAGREYFSFQRNHPGDELYISQVASDEFLRTPHLHFTRRIESEGAFAGVVVLAVAPAYFVRGYERARHGERGLLGLVGTDGVFRVRRSGNRVSWGERPAELGEGDALAPGTKDGVKRFLSVRKLDGYPLYAAGGLAYDEQMAVFDQKRRSTLLTAWGASVGLLAMVTLVGVWSWQAGRTRSRIRRERRRTAARMEQMAHYDELTGLPNRTLVSQQLAGAIAQAHQDGASLAVAFIDLDGFKLVNDGLGHAAGDELLRTVSARMRQVAGQDAILARFGGDEFVLVLPGVESAAAVSPVLDAVRRAVMQPVVLGEQPVRISVSVGAALYPHDATDPDTLMMNANAAMSRAKELGRNNFQFYSSEMNASHEEKLAMLDGLRASLDAGHFSLVYQPKLDLRTGRIFGVEALVRWDHPDRRHVSPARFIPLAEESGMIVQLGEWVLRTACAQNQVWRDAGLPPVIVSVNVSARQFEEQHLVDRVAEALRHTELPPDGLEIEVTESVIMRDMQQAVDCMGKLKAMGISLSVDDFGTGYSSLSALKSFPISTLKIDKSFVSDLATNPDDRAIAMAVISLGHKLNLRVIAEGVETEQQFHFLRDNDCDEMQGNLFSHPVGPDEFADMLAREAHA